MDMSLERKADRMVELLSTIANTLRRIEMQNDECLETVKDNIILNRVLYVNRLRYELENLPEQMKEIGYERREVDSKRH